MQKKLLTALLSWRVIYMPHPDHLKLAGDQRHLIHLEKHLQATQVQIEQTFRLSISFVSVSARISSWESVRAKCCALWLVLEWTKSCISVRWPPWSLVARRYVNDPPAWCEAVSTILYGGRGLPLWASSLVKSGIKMTVIVFMEENCRKQYSSWVLQQHGRRDAFVTIRTTR